MRLIYLIHQSWIFRLEKMNVVSILSHYTWSDPRKLEWADYAALSRHNAGTYQGNKLTLYWSRSARPQSPQLAEPHWTDPWCAGADLHIFFFFFKRRRGLIYQKSSPQVSVSEQKATISDFLYFFLYSFPVHFNFFCVMILRECMNVGMQWTAPFWTQNKTKQTKEQKIKRPSCCASLTAILVSWCFEHTVDREVLYLRTYDYTLTNM